MDHKAQIELTLEDAQLVIEGLEELQAKRVKGMIKRIHEEFVKGAKAPSAPPEPPRPPLPQAAAPSVDVDKAVQAFRGNNIQPGSREPRDQTVVRQG